MPNFGFSVQNISQDREIIKELLCRVVLIHAKAARETRLLSASAFADVCNQAVKNLDSPYAIFSNRAYEPGSWGTKWRASWNGVPPGGTSQNSEGAKIAEWIQSLIRDPAANREVWIVVGQHFLAGGIS